MNDNLTELRGEVTQLMEQHDVSFETGFLAEHPLWRLPEDIDNVKQKRDFMRLDAMAYALEQTISERQVAESVKRLTVPCWSCEELPWPVAAR